MQYTLTLLFIALHSVLSTAWGGRLRTMMGGSELPLIHLDDSGRVDWAGTLPRSATTTAEGMPFSVSDLVLSIPPTCAPEDALELVEQARSIGIGGVWLKAGNICESLLQACLQGESIKFIRLEIAPTNYGSVAAVLPTNHNLCRIELCADHGMGTLAAVLRDLQKVESVRDLRLVLSRNLFDDELVALKAWSERVRTHLEFRGWNENGASDGVDYKTLKELEGLENLSSLAVADTSRLEGDQFKVFGAFPDLRSLDLQLDVGRTSSVAILPGGSDCHLAIGFFGSGNANLPAVLPKPGAVTKLSASTDVVLSRKDIEHIGSMHHLQYLDLSGRDMSDKQWTVLGGLANIQRLDLSDAILDGDLDILSGMRGIESLDLHWCGRITDTGLRRIGGCSALQYLSLAFCRIDQDEALSSVCLPHLTRLVELDLAGVDLGPKAMAAVAGMRNLKKLTLARWAGRNESWGAFANVSSGITRLSLFGSKIDSIGIEMISRITSLTDLDLGECQELGHQGVAALSELRGLHSIGLSGVSSMDDGAIHFLLACDKLEYLDISRCHALTNEGLQVLKELKTLRSLNVSDCSGLTDEAVHAFAAENTQMEIVR